MDNQNFYPPQQNWNQPTPPQKSKNGWVKWVIIGVLVIGFFTAVFIFISNLGKKFGHAIDEISHNALTKSDSTQLASINTDFDSIYTMLGTDSSDAGLKMEIHSFQNNSDSIVSMLNTFQNNFNDSIRGAGALERLTQVLSFNYFIKTGRATKMKNIILAYRETSFHNLPPSEQDSSILSDILIDVFHNSSSGFLKKFTQWENMNFNQPVMNVNLNFQMIRSQIRSFEKDILGHYMKIVTTSQASGIIIIGPNGDTVK
jgi:hypothetical protein